MKKLILILSLLPSLAFSATLSVDANGVVINQSGADFPTGKLKVNGVVIGTGVTSISGTAPISVTGSGSVTVSISAATTSAAGSLSATDKVKLNATSGTNTGDQTPASLGLVIGTNVQAFDSDLTLWSAITPASGIGTFLGTPTSANLRSAITDELGTGALIFNGATPIFGATTATNLTLLAETEPYDPTGWQNDNTVPVKGTVRDVIVTLQPLDPDLTSIAAASSTNAIYYRSAANTWSTVTIGSNLSFTGGTLAAGGGSGGITNSAPAGTIPVTTGGLGNLVASNINDNGTAISIDVPTTIDLGPIEDTPTDGIVMSNDANATGGMPLQNAPLILFKAHGWDFGSLVSREQEMNEKFFTYSNGTKSKFSWEFSDDGAPYEEKVYIDSSGNISGTGYVSAGAAFATANGGLFSETAIILNAPSAGISNGNTTGPLSFNSSNTTALAFRFNAASSLTSGNLIEGLGPNTGFTGSLLKLGKSSNGSTITTTLFEVTNSGATTIAGSLTVAGTISFGAAVRFKNYTVAGLSGLIPSTGDTARVTDALTPAYNATLVGGGTGESANVLAFYNGTHWVAH